MGSERTRVLVVGATGTVGGEVVRSVLAAGGQVRALVRSEARGAARGGDVELVRGDLRDGASLARALEGVSAAFYVSPHEPDEVALAERFVTACEAAQTRIVFVGVHVDAPTRLGRAVRRLVFGRMLANYRPKFRISEHVRTRRARPIVLMPTNFFQNDELFEPEILAGSFPQAFERPINRVDVRDLGLAAARALLDPTMASGAYPVVGPGSLTGEECAAAWSAALGREVRVERDLSRLDAAFRRARDAKKRDDFIATYAVLRRFALPTAPEEVARTTALIGRPPTPYSAYVRATVERWRRAA